MDLFAYSQIDNLSDLLTSNGISIPRLRGIRKMSEEKCCDLTLILRENALMQHIGY